MKWVEEIIDLSKIESGRSDLAHQVFPITDLVEEVTKRLRPEAGNTLTVELPGSLGEMNGDRERVARVLFNLLENAENGKTALKVSRKTVGEMDWLTFVVQDTGAGITARRFWKTCLKVPPMPLMKPYRRAGLVPMR